MTRVRFLDQVPVGAFTTEGNIIATASYAISASYASSSTSASYTISSSYTQTASYASSSTSSSYALTASYVANASSFPYTGSAIITGSLTITGSLNTNDGITSVNINATSITASLLGTASYASQSLSASYALTASYTQNALSSSYASSSTSASYALTASYTQNALSSSYASSSTSASYASTASLAPNYVLTSVTSSMSVATASYVLQAISTSFATSASKYTEIDPIFIAKSASLATTGSNIFIGNQTLTGSLFLSGISTDTISIILPASGAITSSTQSGSYILASNSSSGFSFYAPTALNSSIYALTISGGLAIRNSNLNNLGYIYNPASVNALGVYTAAGLTQYSWMGSGIVSSFSYTTANQNIVGTTGIFAQGILIASGSTTLHGTTTINGAITLNNSFARTSNHIITTGTAFTISGSITTIYTDPTASISSFTYTLPATSSINNGQELLFIFGGNLSGSSNVITTLTISPSAGTTIIGNLPTSANVTSSYAFKYRSDNAKWYRLY